ncbi:MAG TPA: TonB-dependent receptor plug domain-containing protein, partial [Pyrinomonadaceae bacterium]|nr:TonB-dependent receptor plug domain-containing protein [Pyrinomonadaceae bacterium]
MKPLLCTLVSLTVFSFTFCAMVMTVLANGTLGKLVGSVKDASGAAVSSVEITLRTTQQAVIANTVTDENGKFVLDNLAPGSYEISITRPGFKRYRNAVQIASGGVREFDVVLEVNSLSGEVTVTAEVGQVSNSRNVDTQVNVINEDEILQRATEVVAQAVDEETGVNLQRTSPSLSAVFVRGLTGRNVAVFVDGVRYTTSAQRGGVGTFFSLIEPSSLDTVEILRGPNSSQYGSDVHGGVVNFISHAPRYGSTDDEFHGNTNFFYTSVTNGGGGNALVTYGTRSYGLLLNINGRRISTLRPADGLDYHAAVTRFLGLPSNVFGSRLPDTGFTQYGGLIRVSYNV